MWPANRFGSSAILCLIMPSIGGVWIRIPKEPHQRQEVRCKGTGLVRDLALRQRLHQFGNTCVGGLAGAESEAKCLQLGQPLEVHQRGFSQVPAVVQQNSVHSARFDQSRNRSDLIGSHFGITPAQTDLGTTIDEPTVFPLFLILRMEFREFVMLLLISVVGDRQR